MKGQKLVACLEDIGFLVLADAPNGHRVRLAKTGRNVAFYDTNADDQSFRFGWIEAANGDGRRDALDWHTFYSVLTHRYPNEES